MNRPLAAKEANIATGASGWLMAGTAFVIAVAVLLAVYWRTMESLVWVWGHDGTYQYGFLIFPLSLWVAFTLRDQVRATRPSPSTWGLAAVAVLVFVWYAGQLLDVNLARHFAFVALFPALVLACWGWRASWALVFPLIYLVVFAVPWGNGLVGPLQDITARFAVHALEITGTPVLLNGREIITPAATWMVEDACSGVRFFAACTALGCLYAWLMYRRWWKRVLFVALAAVVPIIANGLRVYFTVLIGETWGMHYATGTDHMVFGWQFFGTVLVLLLVAGWFFRDSPRAFGAEPPCQDKPSGTRIAIWPVAIAVLIAGPLTASALASPVTFKRVHLSAPAIAGWNRIESASSRWRPNFSGAAGQVRASYRSAAGFGQVELFHATYTGRPRRGHDLITYGNDVYDPARSRVLSTSSQRVDLAEGRRATVGELRLADWADRGSRLVWYWYCVDRHCTRSPVLTKIWQGWDVLRGHAATSSVWALSSPIVAGNQDQARAAMRAFARTLPMTAALNADEQEPAKSGHEP